MAKIYFRPVIPLLISMILGIVFGSRLPGHGKWAYGFVFCCACLILNSIKPAEAAGNTSSKSFRPGFVPLVLHTIARFGFIHSIPPLLLFFGLGYLCIQPYVDPKFPPNHVIHFADTHPWKIVGIIDSLPIKTENRTRFVLRAETLAKKTGEPFSVAGKIRVTVPVTEKQFSIGNRISFFSRLRTIRNFKNPGGFNYQRHMAFQGIWVTAYVPEERINLLENLSGRKTGYAVVEDARLNVSGFIEKTVTGHEQGLLKALIIGDRNGISPRLKEAFNRTGVGHLLAISGLHIGIIATVSFAFFSWILSHIKPFLRNAWTRKGAAILSLFPVLIYGLLAGMSPSTQRAVIMVTVFLSTFLLERENDLMNTLAVAALVILIVDPPSLFSISFQLSFAAVLSILYGLSKVNREPRMKQDGGFRVHQRMISFLWVSIFAILGTFPLTLFYFNQTSTIGLAANFLMVPLVGFIVVPMSLLSVFLYPFSIPAASWFIQTSAFILSKTIDILCFVADFGFTSLRTVTPTCFEIAGFYALVWAILNLKNSRMEIPGGQKQCLIEFRRKLAKIMVAFLIFAGAADIFYWMNQRFWHKNLRATVIDVGQGSAALLELPGGCCFLVDGGGFSDNSTFDVGARVIAPFLWRKKIKTVDTLILSHANADHLNGLLYIARHFNVKRIWTNHEGADTKSYRNFLEIITENQIDMPILKNIVGVHDLNGVRMEVLYPPADFMDRRQKEKWRNENNNSLVIRVAFGSKSFLFPGDIMERAERELSAIAGGKLKSTVLISPHHGSRTSSSPLFLDQIVPEVVIISSGWGNRFGFPHPSVLERYQSRGYRIFQTPGEGAIRMSTDGRSLEIMPYHTD
ncbi:MAG TPA: DNA internalization-related competence protein ComEC/Rec2 [Desulfobacterales bacterium]|nr:DNA internalization-related competence protein ComEC/Rec2 [Desulfobacterales bacterium]